MNKINSFNIKKGILKNLKDLILLHWEYINPKDNKYYDKKYADRF